MKKSRLYRVGAAFLAALMVFTGMPQGQMYVSAQESGILVEEEEKQEPDQPQTASEEEIDVQENQKDNSPVNQASDSTPGETEDTAAPADSDAVSSGTAVPEASVVSEEPEDSGAVEIGEEEESEVIDAVQADPEPAPVAASIKVVKYPTKSTYLVGKERLEVAGAQIEVLDTEGKTIKTVDVSESDVSYQPPSDGGVVTCTVTYSEGGKSFPDSFDVLFVKVPDLSSIDMKYGQTLSKIEPPTDPNGVWKWADSEQMLNTPGEVKLRLDFVPTQLKYMTRSNIETEAVVTCSLEKHAAVRVEVPSEGYIYDGTQKTPKVTVSVGSISLRQNIDYTLSYGDNINAGTETGSVTVAGTGDCYQDSKTEKFSISKAQVTIKANDMALECGDDIPDWENPEKEWYTVSGLGQENDLDLTDFKFTSDISTTNEPGGVYDIIPEGAKIKDTVAKNYEEISFVGGILTVEPYVPPRVKVSGLIIADKVYDKSPWSYGNGRIEVQNASTGNVIRGLTVSLSYEGTLERTDDDGNQVTYGPSSKAPTEAGEYTLNLALEGAQKDRYILEEESAVRDFRITQKPVTIKARSYTVEAGEPIPTIEELIQKLLEEQKGYYTVDGLLKGDTEANVLDMSNLTLEYETDPTSAKVPAGGKGTYTIQPSGVEVKDKNYTVVYETGTLTVNGRVKFEPDFHSITVEDMTYSSQPHSISGYADGIGNYKIVVTGETRKAAYQNIDEDWDLEDDPEDTRTNNYKRKIVNVPAADILEKYQKIAPTEVGDYTVRIFSEINAEKNLYDYDGEALLDVNFQILPLKKTEMKLVGVTGVTNKIYDRKVTDLSKQIRDARVWTGKDVDITEMVKPELSIREVVPANGLGSGYEDTVFDQENPDKSKMPVDAGSYELVVKIVADESENYVTNEWKIPFAIKKRPLTVTVKNMKVPMDADGDGTLPADLEYEYTITDDSITDENRKILNNDDFEKPLIEPAGEVDTRVTGSYDLNGSGKIGSSDKKDGSNYDVTYVPGKLFVQTKLWGIKELNLTNNKNIPHGKTLEEIAQGYLPKTVVIYLNQNKTVEDTAAITWDTEELVSGAYNINSKTAQNFRMRGTVVLPDLVYVDEADKGWLTVTVNVSVREATDGTQARKPVADIASGSTVGSGTRVSLSTDEEGAQIYYTVEADNPSLSVSSRQYAGPIEIKCTVTIRAVARIYGKLDSEELRLTYYYNKNLKPGGDDNPNDPSNPTVPDEDVPKDEDGKPMEIPKGMWVTDVAQYTYTGKAIKPTVRVYDYRTRLEENKDYTVSYKNNVNAADKNNPTKAPSIVIKGKGNYEGKLNKTFTIAPKNISDKHEDNGREIYDVKIDDITTAFADKKVKKPVVSVSWNGKKLANKKDYTYEAAAYTAAGIYPVKVTGNGNYTGERQISFVITKAVPASVFKVSRIADYNYTGQEIRPTVVVMYQKAVLQQGLEYTVSYEDNKEIGTASVIIKGAGRFSGVKRVNFKIKEAALLNKAQAELVFGSGTVYTGKEIRPSAVKLAVQVKNNGAVETRVLTENDYKVSYQNNVKAGKATAIFEGVGAYGGTLKKTFKIAPCNIQNIQPDQITVQSSYPYMKGGSQQKPVVLFDGKPLQEGLDYTLSYKNNKKVGDTAVVTIKGKGNFTGSVMRTYQVTVQNFSSVKVEPADKVYQAKAGNFATKVRVLDSNGKALAAGKDYDKNVVYTYEERTVLSPENIKNPKDPVAPKDIVPAGTKIRVTVTATGGNYQGTATGTFRVVQADVAKAKVVVPAMIYTGKKIEPKQSEITVMLNGRPLSAEEYQIVGYSNNTDIGTAKLTIQGRGNYGGTKTVSFKIKRKSLLAQLFG